MKKIFFIILVVGLFTIPLTVRADADIDCEMDFTLKSWSFIYKSTKGSGVITCDNGQKIDVGIRAHGGGFTIGKSTVTGHGDFSKVASVSELFGNYATAEAHGGVSKSGKAQAMTKGEVSFSFTAEGRGFDIGVAFGNFKIYKMK